MMKTRQPPPRDTIAADLTARIGSGDLALGAPFPSIRDIAAHYQCAPATAHAAVKTLRDAGHLERDGSGFRVRSVPTVSSPTERRRRVMSGGPLLRPGETQHIMWAGLEEHPPLDALTRLGLEPGSPAGCREYTVTDRAGRVVTYGISWFDPAMWAAVPALRSAEVIESGNIGAIRRELGRVTVSTPRLVSARPGSSAETEALRVPAGTVLLVERVACLDGDEEPLEYNVSVHPQGYEVE